MSEAGISVKEDTQARNENGQHVFEIFRQGEEEVALPAGPDGTRS